MLEPGGLNDITGDVVDSAYKVHTVLGPGLLESVYEVVLAQELMSRGHHVLRQVPIKVSYEALVFDEGIHAEQIC